MVAMSRFAPRHKGAVLMFWLVVPVAGAAASAKLSSRLSPSFALPGAASYQAGQQVLRLYGNGGNGYPQVAVVRLPPGQDAASPAARRTLGLGTGSTPAAVAEGIGRTGRLDATVVRALLVPALIAILGGWNWWLPRPLQRLLRVPASPSAQATTDAAAGIRPSRHTTAREQDAC